MQSIATKKSDADQSGGIPQKVFLSEREAAPFLGISVRSLQTWRQQGGGPKWRKHGRVVRYLVDDLLAWSESQVKSSTSAVAG